MPNKKSKTNTTFFQDIPKIDKRERALLICKALANYTQQRNILLEDIREQRKKIYNLSLEINRLHEENEELIKGG